MPLARLRTKSPACTSSGITTRSRNSTWSLIPVLLAVLRCRLSLPRSKQRRIDAALASVALLWSHADPVDGRSDPVEGLMRAPHRKRPRKDDQLAPGPETDLATVADKVSYIISTEHKDYLTSAGPGNLRSDASACPRSLDFDEVEGWLRD